MRVSSVTVLICTYNRAEFLAETLAGLAAMGRGADYRTEIVVVDNNSTDGTRAVIEGAAASAPFPVRYLFEPWQGKSFALNTGLEAASGDVIALTDDDVIPAPDWLDRIVHAFRTHDITFTFGKVLPRWTVQPPPELLLPKAHEIWGPLAIVDYGDEPLLYPSGRPGERLPVGANLAFRRDVLLQIGGWRTDLGKVNNTLISGEDHEIFFKLQAAGCYAGYYDPTNRVRHLVLASRLTRRYFRRWFYWHGKTLFRMQPHLYDLDLAKVPHIAGAPRFLYRQFAEQCWLWIRKLGRRDALGLLIEELRAIELLGVLVESWKHFLGTAPPVPAERAVRGPKAPVESHATAPAIEDRTTQPAR